MNITEYSLTSELIEIKLDSDEIIEKYNEPIIFYTQSHPKLTTYFNFFEARVNSDYDRLEDIMKTIILNENGKPALKSDETLPADIFTAAILAVGDILGKSVSRMSNSTPGKQTE